MEQGVGLNQHVPIEAAVDVHTSQPPFSVCCLSPSRLLCLLYKGAVSPVVQMFEQ